MFLRRFLLQQCRRPCINGAKSMQRVAGYAMVSKAQVAKNAGYEVSKLAKPLEDEIRYNQQCMAEDESLSVDAIKEKYTDVIGQWKIETQPNVSTVTLVQEQEGGLKTTVRFDSSYIAQIINDAAAGENMINDEMEEGEEDMEEMMENDSMMEPFSIFVEVYNPANQMAMEVEMEAMPDLSEGEEVEHSLAVLSVGLKRPDLKAEEAYPGPLFNSLDDKLQESFGRWAEKNFLPLVPFIAEYSRAKESGDYGQWLSDVKSVISK